MQAYMVIGDWRSARTALTPNYSNCEKAAIVCYAEITVTPVNIIGQISKRQVIATGNRIRELQRLKTTYGAGGWRKYKGEATVQTANGRMRRAEVHWYEAHGVGRYEIKIKAYLD
jgi:hypothetical protein